MQKSKFKRIHIIPFIIFFDNEWDAWVVEIGWINRSISFFINKRNFKKVFKYANIFVWGFLISFWIGYGLIKIFR